MIIDMVNKRDINTLMILPNSFRPEFFNLKPNKKNKKFSEKSMKRCNLSEWWKIKIGAN